MAAGRTIRACFSLLSFLCLLVGSATTARAATTEPNIETVVGTDGLYDPDRMIPITVTVTSDTLWVGIATLSSASIHYSQPLEVPAGTAKEITFEVPARNTGNRLGLRLVPTEGEAVTRVVNLNAAPGATVAIIGDPSGVRASVDGSRSVIKGEPPTVVTVGGSDIDALQNVANAIVTEVPEGTAPDLRRWVEEGGHLVLEEFTVFDLPVGSHAVGEGWVTVVEDLASISPKRWGTLLEEPEPPGYATQGPDAFQSLSSAAVGGNQLAGVELPWLAAVLVGYVVVVGPLNLFLLRRLGKPEWAWASIPLLSALAVGVVVVLGPNDTAVTQRHASIITATGTDSVLVSLASTDSAHTIGIGETNRVANLGFSGQPPIAEIADGEVTYDFRTGEAVHSLMRTSTETVLPDVSIVESDEVSVEVDVSYQGNLEFEIWGVASGGKATIGEGSPRSANLTIQTNLPGDPWASPSFASAFWDQPTQSERTWSVYEPLGWATSAVVPETKHAVYFWGITTDHDVTSVVDGAVRTVSGNSVVIVTADGDTTVGSDDGVSSVGRLMANDGLDNFGGGVFGGSGSVTMEYRMRAPHPDSFILVDNWGMVRPELEVYNWAEDRYDAFAMNDGFDAESHVGPTGRILIRVGVEGGEFSAEALRLERA